MTRTAQFSAASYLSTYYADVMQDERAVIAWLADAGAARIQQLRARRSGSALRLLDLGCGPTVHHMISLAPYVDEIVISDVSEEHLAELARWHRATHDSMDWHHFAVEIERHERAGSTAEPVNALDEAADARIELTRRRIVGIARCDLLSDAPQPIDRFGRFDVVSSFFCADSATRSKEDFAAMLRRTCERVADDGMLIASHLGGCDAYRVGDSWVPSATVTRCDITAVLADAGFDHVDIQQVAVPEMHTDGFDHVFLVAATRSSPAPAGRGERRA